MGCSKHIADRIPQLLLLDLECQWWECHRFWDQITNAHIVEKVWEVGVKSLRSTQMNLLLQKKSTEASGKLSMKLFLESSGFSFLVQIEPGCSSKQFYLELELYF